MMITTRRSGVAAALAATAIVLGASGPALAVAPAASAAGGQVRIFVDANGENQIVQPTLFTGAIGDYGTSTSLNAKGKVDPNGNFEKEKLHHGTFIIDATGADAAANHARPVIDRTTCSVSLTASGPATLSRGTGLYKGIRGTLRVTITYAALYPRLANGKCNFGENVRPLSQFGQVYGAGSVHFG